MLTILIFVLVHFLVFGLLAATAFALGRLVTRGLTFPSFASEFAIASSTGLGCLGLLGLALGLVGLLDRTAVMVLTAGIHGASLPMWGGVARRLRRASRAALRRRLSTAVLGLAVVSPFWVLSLYPPSTFDATMYHLPFAHFFV